MKIRRQTGRRRGDLDLTSMIDVVFQLLAFFVMTFQITTPEGDFNVLMPRWAPEAGTPIEPQTEPIRIRLAAGTQGELTGIRLGDRALPPDFRLLRAEIAQLTRDGFELDVELDCDYGLKYLHAVDALTAVTGYRDPNGKIVRLLDRVKFTPPRGPTAENR